MSFAEKPENAPRALSMTHLLVTIEPASVDRARSRVPSPRPVTTDSSRTGRFAAPRHDGRQDPSTTLRGSAWHEERGLTCPSCGADNKPGRKFCVRCATPLALACPGCGSAYDPGDAFCGDCAEPLTAGTPTAQRTSAAGPADRSQPAQVAERRLVSVLFADLVGFTPFAEERDSEDVRETLSQYFDLASDIVGRYGGTVEKFIGDAVMAVWGTPIAHEDDAERAVRAALELVDAVPVLGQGIQARAGVLDG